MTSPLRFTSLLNRRNGNAGAVETAAPAEAYGILSQKLFARALYIERKRTERSGRGFVLMLLQSTELVQTQRDSNTFQEAVLALSGSSRDTDTIGWFKEGSTIGVIFTELGADRDGQAVVNILHAKVTKALASNLTRSQVDGITLSFHVFPEDWDKGGPSEDDQSIFEMPLYETKPRRFPHLLKRMMDIFGSSLALLFCVPLFIGIAIAIKLTSRGPVFFCQQRLGRNGRKFNFLKFRSMYINNDAGIHQDYVREFIANENGSSQTLQGQPRYKLIADPRVTAIGRFLRKTSLDELPQFLNVLLGSMSLVGPRPPIPYEAQYYKVWHRARLLDVKPGITGLWQVRGRSRVKFDDMVRMDLRYVTSWSLWLDIKILFQTPLAVFSGEGAH